MKLATFSHNGTQSFGVVVEDAIFDATVLFGDGPTSCLGAIQAGSEALSKLNRLTSQAQNPIPLEQVKLLAPIPTPPKVLALAGNYVEHIKESNLGKGLSESPSVDTTPRPFIMPSTAIAGPDDEIPWCVYSRDIDYEIELAIVISSQCKCISPEQAGDYIFGYTIANDISARSTTFAQGRAVRPWDQFFDWLNGKWADGFCPTGPVIVTPDEIGDPTNLNLQCRVNGKIKQAENTSNMIFDVYRIVSFLSHIMTLTPGDIIATGTPSGVGMATGDYLEEGDVITCSIEKIGELTNTLGKRPDSFYAPCNESS